MIPQLFRTWPASHVLGKVPISQPAVRASRPRLCERDRILSELRPILCDLRRDKSHFARKRSGQMPVFDQGKLEGSLWKTEWGPVERTKPEIICKRLTTSNTSFHRNSSFFGRRELRRGELCVLWSALTRQRFVAQTSVCGLNSLQRNLLGITGDVEKVTKNSW